MNDQELQRFKIELENQDKKSDQQRSIVWVAVVSVLVVTMIFMTPLIGHERVALLSNMMEMFYITQAGIIMAFFGSQALMTRK